MAEIEQNYSEMIQAGFNRLEKRIGDLDDRMRTMEMRDAGFSVPTGAKVDAALRRIDELAAALSQFERDLQKMASNMVQLQNILKWILSVATAVGVAGLVAFATGHLAITMVP